MPSNPLDWGGENCQQGAISVNEQECLGSCEMQVIRRKKVLYQESMSLNGKGFTRRKGNINLDAGLEIMESNPRDSGEHKRK